VEKKTFLEEEGMKNLKFNITIARRWSLCFTMLESCPNHIEGVSNYIEEHVPLVFKGEEVKMCDTLIHVPAIICVERRTGSWSLMNQQ